MVVSIVIVKSKHPEKKYDAVIQRPDGTSKTVSFGQAGASDMTQHKDNKRKQLYIARHRKTEDWSANGYETAGWLSRWLLWESPTLTQAAARINKRFSNISITVKPQVAKSRQQLRQSQ